MDRILFNGLHIFKFYVGLCLNVFIQKSMDSFQNIEGLKVD
jgi:hypothetical protein